MDLTACEGRRVSSPCSPAARVSLCSAHIHVQLLRNGYFLLRTPHHSNMQGWTNTSRRRRAQEGSRPGSRAWLARRTHLPRQNVPAAQHRFPRPWHFLRPWLQRIRVRQYNIPTIRAGRHLKVIQDLPEGKSGNPSEKGQPASTTSARAMSAQGNIREDLWESSIVTDGKLPCFPSVTRARSLSASEREQPRCLCPHRPKRISNSAEMIQIEVGASIFPEARASKLRPSGDRSPIKKCEFAMGAASIALACSAVLLITLPSVPAATAPPNRWQSSATSAFVGSSALRLGAKTPSQTVAQASYRAQYPSLNSIQRHSCSPARLEN